MKWLAGRANVLTPVINWRVKRLSFIMGAYSPTHVGEGILARPTFQSSSSSSHPNYGEVAIKCVDKFKITAEVDSHRNTTIFRHLDLVCIWKDKENVKNEVAIMKCHPPTSTPPRSSR